MPDRKGYKPTVFEKNEKPGGMLTYGVPSYKLEKDLIQAEVDVIIAMGVEIKYGIEVGKDITIEDLRKDIKDSILRSAAKAVRNRGFPEKTPKVFIRQWNF